MGVVGALQLDVLQERLKAEYGLPIEYEQSRFNICRWISADTELELDRFMESHRSSIARDVDNAAVYLAESQYSLRYEEERWEKVRFDTVKDYQKKAV